MNTRADLLIAVGVAGLGLAILMMTGSIRLGITRDVIGPRTFPYAIGGFLLCSGTALIVGRLRRMNADKGYVVANEGSEDTPNHPASTLRVMFFFLLTALYCVMLMPAGYLLTTPIFMACAFRAMGERRWRFLVVAPILWTLATYALFSQILSVRLPVGPLAPLFRELGLIIL